MPRQVVGGLHQCGNSIHDESAAVERVRQAMLDEHVPRFEEVRDSRQCFRDLRPETDEGLVKL
jgi:hypothetical protein